VGIIGPTPARKEQWSPVLMTPWPVQALGLDCQTKMKGANVVGVVGNDVLAHFQVKIFITALFKLMQKT
jgi:hypothetical protein